MTQLPVRAPFHPEATVRVLQRRPTNLIDTWVKQRYRRVIRIDGKPLLIEVENRGSIDAPDLNFSILHPARIGNVTTARERREAIQITRRILGLGVDMDAAQQRAEADPALRQTALALRGLRPPRYPDLFETFASVRV